MLLATTPTIEGKPATVQLGLVAAEVIFGANLFKDWMAQGTDLIGGRNRAYEAVIADARAAALKEIEQQAAARGANAIVGVRIDYQVLGEKNGMLMASASGTAVGIPFTAAEIRRQNEEEAVHYLKLDGNIRGPFSIAQLRELTNKARVTRDIATCGEDGTPGPTVGELVG